MGLGIPREIVMLERFLDRSRSCSTHAAAALSLENEGHEVGSTNLLIRS